MILLGFACLAAMLIAPVVALFEHDRLYALLLAVPFAIGNIAWQWGYSVSPRIGGGCRSQEYSPRVSSSDSWPRPRRGSDSQAMRPPQIESQPRPGVQGWWTVSSVKRV
jgi:hypothetical protein